MVAPYFISYLTFEFIFDTVIILWNMKYITYFYSPKGTQVFWIAHISCNWQCSWILFNVICWIGSLYGCHPSVQKKNVTGGNTAATWASVPDQLRSETTSRSLIKSHLFYKPQLARWKRCALLMIVRKCFWSCTCLKKRMKTRLIFC